MRNLTITRQKRFVASLGVMNVYIEDPYCNDLTINGVSCRKLGKLKNGESATFSISEDAARVYVIADKLSKGFCNEYYPLPAGDTDLFLTGKNCFNPATGNAFRFDNVVNPEVLENRRKSTKKGLVILIAAIVIGLIVGFFVGRSISNNLFNQPATEKQFAVDEMRITLNSDFRKQTATGYTAAYGTSDVAVVILQEEFALVEGWENMHVLLYRDIVMKNNKKDGTLGEYEGIPYFEFDAESNGTTYHYIAAVYKGPDAFWLIQFATKTDDANEYREQILDWATSVTFE